MSFGRQARRWNERMCSEVEVVRSLALDFMLRRVENRPRWGRARKTVSALVAPVWLVTEGL